jgi:hypothetical protein
MSIMKNALRLALVGLAAAALVRRLPGRPAPMPIRQAGRDQMRDPPPDWDDVDEAADESFPASDPPGRY